MSLFPGTRLGPYEIVAPLGAGGMGEVYRARDTQLGRDVAIKILPEAFAGDPDRLARFEREARTLASLNDPHIAQIYGLEKSGDVRALVLELVEGPTLADRIARGAIPIDEALPIARQIADALEAAHEQGIVHRDLKPANIKVRHDGTVKVLDFGLAKAMDPASGSRHPASELANSPTITSPALMTGVGVILGTAAYMSPEQAKGREADKRSDIWAFGCVLYEMLTGKRAFAGDDLSETLAAVIKSEPDWSALPRDAPPSLRQALRVCLQKDLSQRARDIHDVRLAIEGAFESELTRSGDRPGWRRMVPVAVASSLATAVLVGGAAWRLAPRAAPVSIARFDHELRAGSFLRGTARNVIALSSDGRQFVYNTFEGLYRRTLTEPAARLIPGTEMVSSPFLSPDGQSVAFFQRDQLKRIALNGGPPVVICSAATPSGMSWGPDDTILFGQPEGIMRVSASGGKPEVVIATAAGERFHGPQSLPDGQSVLFSVTTATGRTAWDQAQIAVQSLRTGKRTVVVRGGSDARYVPTGHLIYALEGGLFAVAFDPNRFEVRGQPASVAQGVLRAANAADGTANYGVSDHGTLVYVNDTRSVLRTLVWVDRKGQEQAIKAPRREYQYPRLSPDGTRVALDVFDEQQDIWMWDLSRETLGRFTSDPARETYPVWTADGSWILFGFFESGKSNLFRKPSDGSGEAQRLTKSPNTQVPTAVSHDGRAVFREEAATQDLMIVSLAEEPRVEPLVVTRFNELNAEISPDGRWIAYQSDESGDHEVYVRPFGTSGGVHLISSDGGTRPLWSGNGRELFYVTSSGAIMSVPIGVGAGWTAGTPVKLFQGPYFFGQGSGAVGRTYDVSADGKRFLMIKPDQAVPPKITVVLNWFEELKRLVPAK